MAKFRKIVCRPRVYRVNTPKGRQIKAMTPAYLKLVAKTANEMIAAGLKIPAPFAHKDGNKVIPGPLADKNGVEVDAETFAPPVWSSDFNSGFWTSFETDKLGNLVGYSDHPGDETDENTNAGKISTTIKETSVWIDPEFTDGLGRTWKNALRHVAVINSAIEPDQENFELIPDTKEYALSMAFSMADEVGGGSSDYSEEKPKGESSSGGEKTSDSQGNPTDSTDEEKATTDEESAVAANIPEIVSLLKEKLGYEMPSDTDITNFLDRLRTILVSIKEEITPDQEIKDLDKKPEKDSETESQAVIMADETNPDNVVFLNKINKLIAKQVEQLQEEFKRRIQSLVATGRVSKKYADATLLPAVGAIAMSHEDMDEEGNLPKHSLWMTVEALEDTPSILDGQLLNTLGQYAVSETHEDEGVKATKEELDETYNSIFN